MCVPFSRLVPSLGNFSDVTLDREKRSEPIERERERETCDEHSLESASVRAVTETQLFTSRHFPKVTRFFALGEHADGLEHRELRVVLAERFRLPSLKKS